MDPVYYVRGDCQEGVRLEIRSNFVFSEDNIYKYVQPALRHPQKNWGNVFFFKFEYFGQLNGTDITVCSLYNDYYVTRDTAAPSNPP